MIAVKLRYPRLFALGVAREIIEVLEPACVRITAAGSLRREKPDVGDVEILYIPRFSTQLVGLFSEPARVDLATEAIKGLQDAGLLERRLNSKGSETYGALNKLMRHCASGIPVDIFAATLDNWFNYLVCRTGPAELNQRISVAAQCIGWRWRPYSSGFFALDNGQVARMESEEDVFSFVGLPYCEPRDRR
jgi:DNA polymerase/3'-5' exonuclease PolX